MKYAPKKQIWVCVSVLLGGTILSTFAAVLVLRNLGGLVGLFVEADADVIMTRELVKPFDAVTNMQYTAERIAEFVLSIRDETELAPNLSFSSVSMEMPLDNTLFFYYKFLGILGNETSRGKAIPVM